jgi:hemerythrin superfamily protein
MPKKDAIGLLKEQHVEVKKMLAELAETTERATKRRTELVREIKSALDAHTTIEEEIFYPRFRDASDVHDDQKMFFEAIEEHRAAKMVLKDLVESDVATPAFGGKAKVLKELVLHHAKEEEEEMFPRARDLFTRDELQDLGTRMEARSEELQSQADAAAE